MVDVHKTFLWSKNVDQEHKYLVLMWDNKTGENKIQGCQYLVESQGTNMTIISFNRNMNCALTQQQHFIRAFRIILSRCLFW